MQYPLFLDKDLIDQELNEVESFGHYQPTFKKWRKKLAFHRDLPLRKRLFNMKIRKRRQASQCGSSGTETKKIYKLDDGTQISDADAKDVHSCFCEAPKSGDIVELTQVHTSGNVSKQEIRIETDKSGATSAAPHS